jgi:hypothetical protein
MYLSVLMDIYGRGLEFGMRIRIGNPVLGDDFWQRADVVDRLVEDMIERRSSRSLFGLRRIGKTSVILEVERRLRLDDGLVVIRLDVQGVAKLGDFLARIVRELPLRDNVQVARAKVGNNPIVQRLMTGVASYFGVEVAEPADGFVNEMNHHSAWSGDFDRLLAAYGGVVLIVDELPFMLRNMLKTGYSKNDVERFMATLRDWRMNCDVRMILGGSLGFGQLKHIDGVEIADHIGDLLPISLRPLEQKSACDFVCAMARGEGMEDWSPKLSAAIVAGAAETWPIFLQYGLNEARAYSVRDPEALAAGPSADVRRQLNEAFYSQFQTRIGRYNNLRPAVHAILKLVAHAPENEGVPLQLIDETLTALNHSDARDELITGLEEDDSIVLDTQARAIKAANKLVPIFVRARSWGV